VIDALEKIGMIISIKHKI